jgi:AhpD family alkylhydroperoxidase
MESRVKALIAIGASVTANCQPCLQYHVSKARESGADDEEITVAIAVAKAVRKGAAAKMDDFAEELGAEPERSACGAGEGCGCSA